MRILIWATHPQFDILALAAHLDHCADVEMLIVARGLAAFRAGPFARARPMRAPMLDFADPTVAARVRAFGADVAIADNRLPPRGAAPALVWTGHGLGWKNAGPADLWTLRRGIQHFTGVDPTGPNPHALVLCHGASDRAWRIDKWRFHPDVCRLIGMPFADLMADPPYDRAALQSDYSIDLARKTVLLNITWHYGGVFAQPAGVLARLRRLVDPALGRDRDFAFVEELAAAVAERDANLLFCLHERGRYAPAMVERFTTIAGRHRNVELKFKDERPDNLADLLIADVMVSNYSSFITPFYLRGRPAIHIRPVRQPDMRFDFAMLTFAGLWARRAAADRGAYMLSLDDTGGPIVDTAEAAIGAVLHGLDHPDDGIAPTRAWLDRHLHRPPGGASAHLLDEIRALVARSREARRP